MPWIRKGRSIYKKVGGRLLKKQTTRSPSKAKSAMRLLHGLERGWRPTRKLGG